MCCCFFEVFQLLGHHWSCLQASVFILENFPLVGQPQGLFTFATCSHSSCLFVYCFDILIIKNECEGIHYFKVLLHGFSMVQPLFGLIFHLLTPYFEECCVQQILQQVIKIDTEQFISSLASFEALIGTLPSQFYSMPNMQCLLKARSPSSVKRMCVCVHVVNHLHFAKDSPKGIVVHSGTLEHQSFHRSSFVICLFQFWAVQLELICYLVSYCSGYDF